MTVSPLPCRRARLARFATVVALCLLTPSMMPPAAAAPPAVDTGATNRNPALAPDPARDKRLAWFREAKFGLFIHWGLYAIPAGHWKGVEYPFIGEWIMRWARIPKPEYEALATRFNPVKFDANAVAQLAKDAGMKYVVITSKHHDGFAMFDSKASRFDIPDATPYKRDPLKALGKACAARGLKYGFYYSQAQDWHEANAAGNDWDFPTPPAQRDPSEYLRRKALPQVSELLANYGPLGLIWFDTPQLLTKQNVIDLEAMVRKRQPDCLINSRLGHGLGDYRQMGDNMVPSDVYPSDWEIPATLNDTWGWKTLDRHWKSTGYLLYRLVDVVSKGGNYLLNVGPTAAGEIPAASVERLQGMGKWLARHGEAIYGTSHSPFSVGDEPWRATVKPGKLYIHLLRWPAGGRFELRGLQSAVTRAYLLSDETKAALKTESAGNALMVSLPADAPDPNIAVLVLEYAGTQPEVTPALRWDAPRDVVTLTARDASPHGPTVRYSEFDQTVDGFTNARDEMQWHLLNKRTGKIAVEVEYAAPGTAAAAPGDELECRAFGQRLTARTPGTQGAFRWVALGSFEVGAAGLEQIQLRYATTKPGAGVRIRALRVTQQGR
jgi:alpha-L-fucosidase